MSIEISNLVKIYGEQKAVDNISFQVSKGEIVGFLGPNGAGKSTTMKILTGYLGQDEGEAKVCGIPVRESPLDTKKARIEAVIALVGLTVESNKRLGQLSKGYKQRVGLAAALIHDPEVLILDEPTSGLDPNQIIEIRDVIKRLGKDKTVLFSSHILQEVEALCDRVVIINRGRLVADSPISRLRMEASGSGTIRVAFRETLEPAKLQALKGVESILAITDKEWELQTKEPDEVKKQLLELALQNNWNIVSLQSENRSLEAIFRSLTQ